MNCSRLHKVVVVVTGKIISWPFSGVVLCGARSWTPVGPFRLRIFCDWQGHSVCTWFQPDKEPVSWAPGEAVAVCGWAGGKSFHSKGNTGLKLKEMSLHRRCLKRMGLCMHVRGRTPRVVINSSFFSQKASVLVCINSCINSCSAPTLPWLHGILLLHNSTVLLNSFNSLTVPFEPFLQC